MAVMAREAWTDQRLDDLNERIASIERRMEVGFAEIRAEFKSVREAMDAGFKEAREAMDTGLKETREALDVGLKEGREAMDAGLKEGRTTMNTGLKEAQAESVSIRQDMANQFAAQNRMIVQLAGGMFGTMVIGFVGTIATIIVQT